MDAICLLLGQITVAVHGRLKAERLRTAPGTSVHATQVTCHWNLWGSPPAHGEILPHAPQQESWPSVIRRGPLGEGARDTGLKGAKEAGSLRPGEQPASKARPASHEPPLTAVARSCIPHPGKKGMEAGAGA